MKLRSLVEGEKLEGQVWVMKRLLSCLSSKII